jgi:hypothetical protein
VASVRNAAGMQTRNALGVVATLALATTFVAPHTVDADAADSAPYQFAVIGDVPYGDAQVAAFPGMVDQMNADPDVRLVAHVGDIKNGSSPCSDEYFAMIRSQLDRFATPVVYTPGDNEWTDCHRPAAGSYDPYERLDRLRDVFFDAPGTTLGTPMQVDAQDDLPENVDWQAAGLTFVAAHVVGSRNGLTPWTGTTVPNERQRAEVAERTSANIAQLREAFADARAADSRAVVVLQQADMFDPGRIPTWADLEVFQPWVQALIDEAATFDGKVYLFDGDSHVYNVDRPLAEGSAWLERYRVEGSADDLVRVTVQGEDGTEWLKVRVNPTGRAPLTWERVRFS